MVNSLKTNKKKYLVLIIFFLTHLWIFGNTASKAENAIPPYMVKVPAGKYVLFFSEKEGKTAAIKSFYIDVNAVTNSEFLQFVKANPKWSKSKVSRLFADAGYLKHWKNDFNIGNDQMRNSPVTNVSWYAATAYCKWKGKRLPTLNEWEYVGSAAAFNNKSSIEKIILSWYSKPTPAILPPVHSTFKNKFNVYDMHGLVWEWVSDFNSVIMTGDSRSNSAINRDLFCASGSTGAADKEDYAAFMRFAFRSSLKAKYTVNNLGFRCAMDIN